MTASADTATTVAGGIGPANVPTPSLAALREAAARLAPHVLRTPTVPWPGDSPPGGVGELHVKLELLQKGGSFKPRGALNTLLAARAAADAGDDSAGDVAAGAVAFSAGNHAIATAWAGRTLGIPVEVVMPESANPFRVARCRELGAEIVFGRDIADLVAKVADIRAREGRVLVHPFEGPATVEGTACVGLELADDVSDLDAVIVPVGGGGLIAGIATAFAHVQPDCLVIGVEPEGARGMTASLAKGAPLARVDVATIADSLGAPFHTPYAFALVERHVSRVVTVTDAALVDGMRRLFGEMNLAVEPACAASLAALSGPLAGALAGRRVALLACGSNIDRESWWRLAGS